MERDLRGTLIIVGSVVGGLALLVGVAIAVSSGGDDGQETRRVVTPPEPPTTTSTTFRVTTTIPSTTLPPITSPATSPPTVPPTITPGTVVVIPTAPPTAPPTTPPTAPVVTTTPTTVHTTTTTHPPTVEQQLANLLETTLRTDGTLPPDELRRVAVDFDPNSDERVRVTWALDPALTPEQQRYTARLEATALLHSIQGFDQVSDERIVLRATLPDVDTGQPARVVRLVFEPDTLAALDFTTLDPLSIFDLADVAEIDPALLPTPPPTTTTSSTTTTTHK